MDAAQNLYDLLQQEPAAKVAYDALSAAGGVVYIVGGAVRDTLLGKNPKDLDLLVTGLPPAELEQALTGLGRLDFTGKDFGVYRFKIDNSEVEVALPRTERSTGTGHKDFRVNADPYLPVEEDLRRRDFKTNAMALDIDKGVLVDPYDGQADTANRTLSLVNNNAFIDDPLRIVRALVSYAVHGLTPDEDTLQAMRESADKIRYLAPERIQMELDKLIAGDNPAEAFTIAAETGVLEYLIPEVAQTMGFDQQNIHHTLDVGTHSLEVLRNAAKITHDPDVRLAALLHDIGKPDSFWLDDDGNGHFYEGPDGKGADHQDVGAQMATEFMKRMAYPNNRIKRVTNLVQNHMFPYLETARQARKFLNSLDGDEQAAWDLMKIREADSSSKDKSGTHPPRDKAKLERSVTMLQKVIEEENAFTIKDLTINGKDLIDLGITPGPSMGKILNDLLAKVLDDPELNKRDTLIDIVREQYLDPRKAVVWHDFVEGHHLA
jgi:tRNA nucleotidyltransferase (CCA-adding enzyme)